MSFFASEHLRELTAGRWIEVVRKGTVPTHVSTDTRGADLAGSVFVALRGPRHDGHDHLAKAAAGGAACAIVERVLPAPPRAAFGVLLVEDTRRALAQLAAARRSSLTNTRVIAVTGSVGKTTTKRLIHAVLGRAFEGGCAPRSFNNEIGVPLTILAAREADEYLVVEIGTNHPGEIAQLARIARPDVAVITAVGRSHLAGFGSIDAVAREKGSLLAHVAPGAAAVINADAPGLDAPLRESAAREIVRYGEGPSADLRLTARGAAPVDRAARGERVVGGLWWLEVNGRDRFDLALPGRHNAVNALAAIAVGRHFGVADREISAALGSVKGEPMRFALADIAGVRVHNDAWNANPDSMDAALETFAELSAGASRRVVVLGDMLELGDQAGALHRDLGRRLVEIDRRVRIDRAILVGPLASLAAEALSTSWEAERFTTMSTFGTKEARAIAESFECGDEVLLKASRGVGLERVIEALEELVRVG